MSKKSNNNPYKQCPVCGESIHKKAVVCPKCGCKIKKPIYKKWWFWVIIIILAYGLFGGGSNDTKNTNNTNETVTENTESKIKSDNKDKKADEEKTKKEKDKKEKEKKPKKAAKEKESKEKEQKREYTSYSAETLFDELDSNALAAERAHQDEYIELYGYLGTIDSDGEYIGVGCAEDDYEHMFSEVLCDIKDDSQLDKVLSMSKGDPICLRGKITHIGEIMGYKMDIIQIK